MLRLACNITGLDELRYEVVSLVKCVRQISSEKYVLLKHKQPPVQVAEQRLHCCYVGLFL